MSQRPPPFIALIGPEGVNGYVRADRIETIGLHFVEEHRDRERPLDATRVWGARVSMFNGVIRFTRETPDEVFAKMADALHVGRDEVRDD